MTTAPRRPSGPGSSHGSSLGSPRPGGSSSAPPRDETAEEAQARLDQIRVQAGGALSGSEISRRLGRAAEGDDGAPPLDWRLTPRNVILQLLAVVAFLAAFGFMASLAIGGILALFG